MFSLTVLVAAPFAIGQAEAKEPVYQSYFGSVAIDGTDTVAYFTEGRPVEGSSDITYDWNGATWRFSTEANRDAFAANPEKYAPQYGGYCAWAVSQGYTASTVPEAWKIVDGKLYLNYSVGIQNQWEQDIPGNIASGDQNWPKVLN
ncbi:MAG: YHS domain-containing (seleno)protein [Pseudomonadota bacterium]